MTAEPSASGRPWPFSVLFFQKHRALGRLLAVQVDGLLDQSSGVSGAVLVQDFSRRSELVVQRVILGIVRDKDLAGGSQGGVDGGFVALGNRADHEGERQHKREQRCEASP